VEASGKTPAGAVKFMENEVRKRFSHASGMVTITDEEGFGIAMHYFEDGNADDFEPCRKSAKAAETKDEKKDAPKARKAKKAPPAEGSPTKARPEAQKDEAPEAGTKEPEAPKPEKPKLSKSEERDRAAGQTFLF